MKSTAIAAAILASVAAAQPHGHHRRHRHEDQLEKRALVVEWETVWETATVYVDEYTTETVLPSKTAEPEPTTSTGVPIQFFETPTTLATSTTAPTVEEVPVPTTTEAPPAPTTTEMPPAPTTTYVPESEPEPTTVEPPPVVETPTSAAPPPPPPAEETTTSTPPAAQPTVSPPESGSSNGSGSSSGGSGGGEGDITYFNVALGACGYDDTGADETENIVALPAGMWDAESTLTSYGIDMPAHPWCDKIITIEAPNGNTVEAKVRDRCPGCEGASIDVTPHAFKQLYDSLEVGRTEAKWWFNN